MTNELSSGTLWNKAAIAGLILAAATIAFSLLRGLSLKLGGIAGGFLGFILWFGKIAACILLIRFFFKKLNKNQGADARALYGYGLRIALCSSLLVAAFSLAQALQLTPESYMEEMESVMASYPVQMDSNMTEALDQLLPKMPVITFFTMLIYCFIWGMFLSSLFSKSIAPSDPFGDSFPNNNDNNDGTPDNQ